MQTYVTTRVAIRTVATAAMLALGAGIGPGCRGDYNAIFGGGAGVGGGSDFLSTGRTQSFFTATQADPRSEDSAGPQFADTADFDGDGRLDIVSAWSQSQPVQIHLQRTSVTGRVIFETVTLAGNVPVVAVAGLAAADFDQDGRLDVAVLLKETLGPEARCLDGTTRGGGLSGLILLFLAPTDPAMTTRALAWTEVTVEASRLSGSGDAAGGPDSGGYTAMAVGDMDVDGDVDVAVAWNSDCGMGGTHDVLIYRNRGALAVRDGNWAVTPLENEVPTGGTIKDVALGDVDLDGDLDVFATFPDAASMNVRWYRNPTVDIPDDVHVADGTWQVGVAGQVATSADSVHVADIDGDGRLDAVVRSSAGRVIQWLKGPGERATSTGVGNIPWQVYTIAEFDDRTPGAVALGDVDADGRLELVAAADSALIWFDPPEPGNPFDQWTGRLIVDDASGPAIITDPGANPAAVVGGTVINSVHAVDIDDDGFVDLVATFDRSGLSGLTNDALVWFRNTR
jgi:hypothetical protein